MLYAFYGITLASSCIALLSKKKLLKQLAWGICFIFMFIFLGWAAGAYDVEIGISRYVDYERYESFTEIGFQALILLGHALRLNYRAFYVIVSLFELLVMFWFIKRHCTNPLLVLLFFMIFPMVIFFQYTRNLLAFAFVIIAFDAMIKQDKFFLIKYVLLIIVASSIHLSSIVFLLYVPALYLSLRKVVLITTIIFILISIRGTVDWLYDIIYKILGETKVDIIEGTVGVSGTFGRIAAIILTLSEFWIIYFLAVYHYRVEYNDGFTKVMLMINVISLLFIPLTVNVGVGFGRIPTLLTIVNYVYLVNIISQVPKKKGRVLLYLILLAIMICLFVANFRNAELRELLLIPFFEENELIEMFMKAIWIKG